ncbi:uncharacterized protein GLRG_05191 [Colletotrichum graminicola M1.001]|uniref:NADAR domain-containing protein n=1 Tax=Colletotrichum graminicola (strain M1.001 / M2 / FGSC 10212) TaxID=645133 RepID=E3QGQ9_COLGM|nr:uncharacterized protein GLRG_05191 [Colletotrichum graminicola M1.001]EFQ30047.1 hypothetical protein GLRG_05191 [Colletotrichum graminicola M1.001]
MAVSNTQRHTQNQDQVNDNPLFFFMPNEEWGEFCQWYKAVFTVSKEEISGLVGHVVDDADPHGAITFNCAEQFMMYCKAARFHDYETQARVLSTSSPKEQKAHGRATAGFTHENWDQVKSEVVVAGNIAKFSQNPHLGRKLLSTGDRLLCEAASKDRVWGIGYAAKHAMSQRRHWGGESPRQGANGDKRPS